MRKVDGQQLLSRLSSSPTTTPTDLYFKRSETKTTPTLPLSIFSFFDFFQAGRTLAWFSLLVLRCGSGCQIKAQAAARVGRSGTSEEGAGRTPQLLSKGNIVMQ